MTEQENNAIEELKEFIKNDTIENVSVFTVKKILALIENQQKEIEELKEDLIKKPIFLIKDLYNPKLKEISLQDVKGLIKQGREEMKDKIKAKIEELELTEKSCITNTGKEAIIHKIVILEQLLEE